MVEPNISQLSQRAPARLRNGTRARSWPIWVLRRIGATWRSDLTIGSPISSRAAANVATVDCVYTSPTATSGNFSRTRLTTWAAVSEPPPKSKKSSLGEVTSAPSTSFQISAIQAWVPASPADACDDLGSGHGNVSRSTLPDVRVGRESTTASRGTSAAGRRCLSSSIAWDAS